MINRISSSTVITIVIIKVTMKRKKRNKKQISIKTLSSLDSATPCLSACMCVIPVLRFKHTSPCFTHKIQFPTGIQIITHERTLLPCLFQKQHQVTFHVAIMAVFIWNVCSLCKNSELVQVSSRGMSFTVCICVHLSCSLSTTRLLFGFLNDRKQTITLEYQLFYIFNLQKFQFCILLKLSIVTLIYNLNWRKTSLVCYVSFSTAPSC